MKGNQQAIAICFFVSKTKVKDAKWPIFACITVNNFSIKEWVGIKVWDEKHNRAKDLLPELRQLNNAVK